MRKLLLCFILIGCTLFFSACISKVASMIEPMIQSTGDKANARLEQVIEAINQKDQEALQSMFSEKALREADDFDGSVDALFAIFEDEIVSWEKANSGPTIRDSVCNGQITYKKVKSYYYITYDDIRYYFSLDEYPVDKEHPDNVGLYSLIVVNEEDKKKVFDPNLKMVYDGNTRIPRPGIYLPFN